MNSSASKNPTTLAAIFDMDGVLIDSVKLNWQAINEALTPYNLKIEDAAISRYLGKTLEDQVDQINSNFHLDISYAEFAPTVSGFKSALLENLTPKPGALGLIKSLKESQVQFAVATSTSRAIAKRYLDDTGLLKYFDTIIAAEDVRSHKPDPEVYTMTAEALGVCPAQCVVFEDAPAGVRAAKTAGMSCIALSTKYVSSDDLQNADLIIPSLESIDLSIIYSLMAANNQAQGA